MDLQSDLHPRFQLLRTLIKFAALLGLVQSIIWIGFAITGMLAYFCMFDFSDASFTSITRLTFFEVYFHGSCTTEINGTLNNYLKNITSPNPTLLTPSHINICLWVYMVLNFAWFISSATLIRNVHENHLRRLNIFLYIWIFITMDITALDLGLGVVFGIDYGEFAEKSAAAIEQEVSIYVVILEAAKVASITMLIMALKGFLFWLTNVCFAIYFFMETFSINEAAVSQTSLVTNDVISDTHSVQMITPSAYEASNPIQTKHPIRLNTEALERANKVSLMSLKERHANRENMDADRFRQYAPRWEINLPDPDYTPPMPRAKIFHEQNGQALGNTRF